MSKKLIEKKEWQYYLYEDENVYELKVPLPKPAPGFDVLYLLSNEEKEAYLTNGIQSLIERIKDMKENHSNYKLQSWR